MSKSMITSYDDAIINPVKGKKAPDLSPLGVMISSDADFQEFIRRTGLCEENFKKLMMSRVCVGEDFSLTGPVVSAPYAVMLLETLIAWGAEEILFFGWCGAISPDVRIGDIILPTGAIIDEGTSRHYHADEKEIATPSPVIFEKLRHLLSDRQMDFHEGVIWTLDAIYRETSEKVKHFQSQHVLAVEMELSALFTVGRFRGVDVGGVLVVSDELSSLTWHPGFKDDRFRQSRAAMTEMITEGMIQWNRL